MGYEVKEMPRGLTLKGAFEKLFYYYVENEIKKEKYKDFVSVYGNLRGIEYIKIDNGGEGYCSIIFDFGNIEIETYRFFWCMEFDAKIHIENEICKKSKKVKNKEEE